MIILDASKMGQRKAAHEYLQEMLPLPGYYGRNLDALYDCLTEMEELEVSFTGTEEAEPYFEKVLRVFRDAARRNTGLTILDGQS